MKEIYICNDGVIILYKYRNKRRYVVHLFNEIHNGKTGKVFIDKEIRLKKKLCELKMEKKLK